MVSKHQSTFQQKEHEIPRTLFNSTASNYLVTAETKYMFILGFSKANLKIIQHYSLDPLKGKY